MPGCASSPATAAWTDHHAIVVATGPAAPTSTASRPTRSSSRSARRPRAAERAPDGERILTWTQLYDMKALPEHLIVVGSGVTGAEFASAYMNLGAKVTLISSRDQVLPGEDATPPRCSRRSSAGAA
jgi:dihydrolipoamide dehydrogenase